MRNWSKNTWQIPGLMGVITLLGLVSALLGTEGWAAFSWVMMLIPLATICRKIWDSKKETADKKN